MDKTAEIERNHFISYLKKLFKANRALSTMFLSLLIGILGGLFAVLFRLMIKWSHTGFTGLGHMLFGFLPNDWWIVTLPALAGIIVGPLTYFFAREAKGHGVPEVMEAVALKDGKMRMRVIFVKALASASSIGAGASVGREGPIIQMGSGIGSVLASFFKLNKDQVKTYVACGAAAGISATFNAPIAGVFFAQEIILGNFTASTFSPIVISSVTAAAIAQLFIGTLPAFSVEAYTFNHPVELLFYAFLGLLAALVGYIFIKLLYKSEDVFNSIKIIPEWFKPVIGGLIIGLIGIKFPQILGVGYGTIEATFQGHFLLGTLLTLVLLKVVATSLTLGSGHSGGVFAPALFMGATTGGAFGYIIQELFPNIVSNPGAYAIVGMGAVVAGTTQAPITAMIIIFEMTRDYRLILPLMIAIVISTMLSSYMSKGTIYTIKLLRRGINLESGKDVNIMKKINVNEVMTSKVEVVRDDEKVGNVIELMHSSKHNGFPVLNEKDEVVGIITLQDIREAPVEGIMEIPVSKLMTKKLIITHPNETLDDVFRKLNKYDLGHLLVVSQHNTKQLLGILTRSDIVKAYDKKLITSDEVQDLINKKKLDPKMLT